MAEVKVENKPVRVLVEVKSPDGSVSFEWRDVPGTEISLEGIELKNGDTLTIESTELRREGGRHG